MTSSAVPRDFLCEHSSAKSRVLALLAHPDGPACLQAVLTCRDATAAQEAAMLLRLAAVGGALTKQQQAAADKVAAALPDAPAASFRHALAQACTGNWAAAAPALFSWPGHDAFDWTTGEDGTEALPISVIRTPGDAHLADLPGPVVRVVQMREFHIYDQDKVLAAATGIGWEAAADEDLAEDDPRDLLGAVMHDPESICGLPGLDVLTDIQEAKLLETDRGDELADWSPLPIVADFGTGWRLRRATAAHSPLRPQPPEADRRPRPDFVALFPVRECGCQPEEECEDCGWSLTPRTAEVLRASLLSLAEDAYDDAEDLGDAPARQDHEIGGYFFARLPHLTWAMGRQWRRGIARACDDLAGDIERGRWPEPTCAAEEIVLHLAIDDAPDHLPPNDNHAALPCYGDDYDWDACSDLFFQDHDILWLYDEKLAGVHELSNPVADPDEGAESLADSWFSEFGNVTPRSEDRGYRR